MSLLIYLLNENLDIIDSPVLHLKFSYMMYQNDQQINNFSTPKLPQGDGSWEDITHTDRSSSPCELESIPDAWHTVGSHKNETH